MSDANEFTVVIYNKPWNEIQEQDWPDRDGTVFVTIDPNVTPNGQRYRVSLWLKTPWESVHGLGSFWHEADAVLFANAKSDEIAVKMRKKSAIELRAEALLAHLREAGT